MSYHVAPIIGYHRAPLSQKFGAPRQPNLVAIMSVIDMQAPYDTPLACAGLENFSHIWVSWQFHHNHVNKSGINQSNKGDSDSDSEAVMATSHAYAEKKFRAQIRPPRLGGNKKVGVFASRSMYRPSGLGLSVVKLERIECIEGRVLLVIRGADMIDGTPIIDIKPYVAYSDAIMTANSGFAARAPVRVMVTITQDAWQQFQQMVSTTLPDYPDSYLHKYPDKHQNKHQNNYQNNKQTATAIELIHTIQQQLVMSDIEHIKALVAQDPRPAYRRDELNAAFTMRYKLVDVRFELIAIGQLQITAIYAV